MLADPVNAETFLCDMWLTRSPRTVKVLIASSVCYFMVCVIKMVISFLAGSFCYGIVCDFLLCPGIAWRALECSLS